MISSHVNTNFLLTPMSSKMFMSLFLQTKKKLSRIFLHIVEFNRVERPNFSFSAFYNGSTQSQPKNKVLMYAKQSVIFKNKIKCIYILTINSHLALALHPRILALRSHVGKVTRGVGWSTDTVFTKRTCKESQMRFTKKVKCQTILKLDFFTLH